MSDRLSGVLGNERLELALCPLVVKKGAAGAAEQSGELGPGIRRTHVDDADRLDTRSRRLSVDEVGSFARLDAPPELFLGRHQDTQVRSEEHTSELQSQSNLVCRLLLEKKKTTNSCCVF